MFVSDKRIAGWWAVLRRKLRPQVAARHAYCQFVFNREMPRYEEPTFRRYILFLFLLSCILTSHPAVADRTVRPELERSTAAKRLIDGLGEREGLTLPAFDVRGPTDGLASFEHFATRGPGVRDFSNKWVWAPDRNRALYCGGNHGVPHKFNDLWEYDLGANTWVMLHAPEPGVEPSHTWWGLTYDTKRRRVLWMATRADWPLAKAGGPPLMAYDPQARNGWRHVPTKPDIRIAPGGSLTYLPNRDRILWYGNTWHGSGLQELDPETGVWQELLSQQHVYFDNPDSPGSAAIINHDSTHDVLVGFLNHAIHVYDFETNRWTRRHQDILPVRVREAGATTDYDPVNDVHMIYSSGRLFAYHHGDDRLEELTQEPIMGKRTSAGYFDREHEVFVLYNGTPRVYVYRYGEPPGSRTD